VSIDYSSDFQQPNSRSKLTYLSKKCKGTGTFISKKYWQDMNNFVKQISIKFVVFDVIKINLVQTGLSI